MKRTLVCGILVPASLFVLAIQAAPSAASAALPASPHVAARTAAETAPGTEAPAKPQTGPTVQETTAEVPELYEFHDVIFRLWHEAWPAKDFEMLAALLPEIEEGAGKVEAAVLPGILRGKRQEWDAGVEELRTIVSMYGTAVSEKDMPATLDAGERLHSQFERLVRLIRPPLEEIDSFHQVLYKLYHYDLPAYDLEAIRESARLLEERMAGLNQATLPPRLQSKQGAFDAGRAELGEAVAALIRIAEEGKERKAVEEGIETMHDKYVALASLF